MRNLFTYIILASIILIQGILMQKSNYNLVILIDLILISILSIIIYKRNVKLKPANWFELFSNLLKVSLLFILLRNYDFIKYQNSQEFYFKLQWVSELIFITLLTILISYKNNQGKGPNVPPEINNS